MARMLGLQVCGGSDEVQMIFIRGNFDSEAKPVLDTSRYPELSNFPGDGWSTIKIGSVRIWEHAEVPDLVCELFDKDLRRNIDYNSMESADTWRIIYSFYPIINSVVKAGGTVTHCAMFELDGKGALIAAKSGTGKSTCYRRIERPWHAISDEQALIVRVGEGYHLHPTPTWSDFVERGLDYSRDIQWTTPLSAFFFLEQAKEDEVVPLGKGKAAMEIYNSSEQMCRKYILSLGKEQQVAFRNRLLDNAFEISRRVPSFMLRATLNGRFWDEMAKVLP